MRIMIDKVIEKVKEYREKGEPITNKTIYELVFLTCGKEIVDGVRQELLDRGILKEEDLKEVE